ncbi:PREDICTED: putative uncharacterized protein DDB_G0282133 [Polistes dominula]|uniref:non-specific serine/threonine protein kinase n=1 Tax=Polistes dominula TaxID=743375 RepID=A0ABM1J291_POLDO|nr:PREDICTED: putative uncharacterized protein DDB_G0282133 [Polistes dominula]
MIRKPIRTYQKKNTANSLKKFNDFVKLDLTSKTDNIIKKQHEIDHFKGNKDSEGSLDYDPFETTFDRIAKDAVVPAIPPDCINNDSWSGSSSDMNSEEENRQSLFHISFSNPIFDVSPNVKRKKNVKTQSYQKKVQPKNKKTSVKGTLNNSQHSKNIRKVKKTNQTKTYKTKKSDILNTDVNNQTNNENIVNNNVASYNSNQKDDIDLCNKPLSPLREITDNINKDSTINPTSSTPINIHNRKNAYSLCYSPINIESLTKNINHSDEDKTVSISHISTSFDPLQPNNLHVLNQTNTNTFINVESDTKDKISYMEDKETSTSNDNFSTNDGIKIDEQEKEILNLVNSKQNLNFINNREAYATTFIDDSIDIALRQKNDETQQENKPLLNHINFSTETHSRSLSLFDDYENKLHTSEDDNRMSAITKKSFINTNVCESNANTELKYESITLDKDNTEEIITSEVLKEKELPPITITKQQLQPIMEYIKNEDEDMEEISSNKLMNENHIFTQLKNSVQITKRRQQHERKEKYKLNDIYEDGIDINRCSQSKMKTFNEKLNEDILSENTIKDSANNSVNITTHCDERNSLINKEIPALSQKSIFLKPGKSWARSLSILCNFQNGLNLNRISIQKGKRWRHSVKDILDMQKKDFYSKYSEVDEYLDKSQLTDICDTNQSGNSQRFPKRTSIRVVRDSRIIKNASDTSFLEVFGIETNIKNRLTLPKNNRDTEYSTQTNHVESNFVEIPLSKTAKDVILQKCSQQNYLPFTEMFSTSYLKFCQKIGEGVYGEVFLHEKDGQKSVLKIIPIEGDQLVNGESQKKFNEILSEIVIAKELHNLRFNKRHSTNGFVEVKNIKCIQGKYPEEMIDLWKYYDEKKRSENDCPSIFDEKQLYICFELGHGGENLESFVFETAEETHTLFIQTTLALAIAERSLKFEHRDLHWGNVLISRTDEQYINYTLDNKDILVPSNGIKVCIIDFTLSRMSYEGCCIFNDLASDPALFTAQGEYQFDIYRLMRDKVFNNWQEFEPYTNVLWLHYVLDKMITMVRYKKKNLKKHKNSIIQLKNLKEIILSYSSAFDLVKNCTKISNFLMKR